MSFLVDGELDALVPKLLAITDEAGHAIMDVYSAEFDVDRKDDRTPVTEADRRADNIIVPALERLTPGIPVVSEERPLTEQSDGAFWLVDPLDGTREFIHRRDEFTVNIALVQRRRPVLGVVGVPAQDVIYWASPKGAFRRDQDRATQAIAARGMPRSGIVVATSRSHATKGEVEDLLAGYTIADRIIVGSALKFCLVAEGQADLYPRLGPTMEWDTAAGQAVVERAGGRVETLDGEPFLYAKPGFLNGGFLVHGADG